MTEPLMALATSIRDAQVAKGFDARAVDAIIRAWPDQAVEIFAQLQHDGLSGCYFFTRWGLYVGVEYDGYIHT